MANLNKVTFKKLRYNLESARLILDDSRGEFNHPLIVLKYVGDEGKGLADIVVNIDYQRHEIPRRDGLCLYDNGASGFMDTKRRWSAAYASHVRLAGLDQMDLSSRPFQLSHEVQFRIHIGRAIGKVYEKITGVEDDCERTVLALEKLGVKVEKLYRRINGLPGTEVPLEKETDLGANAAHKAREAALTEEQDLMFRRMGVA